jgi:hypothetical protein
VSVTVNFPRVDWALLKDAYGWPALQYQAWIRGKWMFAAAKIGTIVLYTDNVLELAIDGKRFFGGDFYSFRRAPIVLSQDQFAPGVEHVIDIRVIRDVRAMGGVGYSPSVGVLLEAQTRRKVLEIVDGSLLVPDVVKGVLSSDLASVAVCNNGLDWFEVVGVQSTISVSHS